MRTLDGSRRSLGYAFDRRTAQRRTGAGHLACRRSLASDGFWTDTTAGRGVAGQHVRRVVGGAGDCHRVDGIAVSRTGMVTGGDE